MTNPTRASYEATQQNTLGRQMSTSRIISSLPDGTHIILSLYPQQKVEVLYAGGEVKTYKTLEQLEKDIPGFIQAQRDILAIHNQFQAALPPDTLQGPPLQGLQQRRKVSSAPPLISDPSVSSPNMEISLHRLQSEKQQPVGVPQSTGTRVTHLATWTQPSLGHFDNLGLLFPSINYLPLSAEVNHSEQEGYDPDSDDDNSEDDTSFSISAEVNQLVVQQERPLFQMATPIPSSLDQMLSSVEREEAAGFVPASGHGHCYFQQATPIPAPSTEEFSSSADDTDFFDVSPPITIPSSFNFTSSVTSVERYLELDVERDLVETNHPRLYSLEGDPAD